LPSCDLQREGEGENRAWKAGKRLLIQGGKKPGGPGTNLSIREATLERKGSTKIGAPSLGTTGAVTEKWRFFQLTAKKSRKECQLARVTETRRTEHETPHERFASKKKMPFNPERACSKFWWGGKMMGKAGAPGYFLGLYPCSTLHRVGTHTTHMKLVRVGGRLRQLSTFCIILPTYKSTP